ncbi:hypothetical protein REPUB_Repub04eG0258300 [Reevesia pubescens]
MSVNNADSLCSFIMLNWGLWESRNDSLHKGVHRKSTDVLIKAPYAGFVKVNFDAAIFKEMRAIGIGAVIRDSGGNVLALLSKKMNLYADAYVAECIAFHEAFTFSVEVGMRNIVAEWDSTLTVGAVNSLSLDHSIAGGIVEAVKLLFQRFNSFKLLHVRRGGNQVAHSLAKHAKEVEDFEAWLEDIPPFLHALVLKDFCNSHNLGVNNHLPLA